PEAPREHGVAAGTPLRRARPPVEDPRLALRARGEARLQRPLGLPGAQHLLLDADEVPGAQVVAEGHVRRGRTAGWERGAGGGRGTRGRGRRARIPANVGTAG